MRRSSSARRRNATARQQEARGRTVVTAQAKNVVASERSLPESRQPEWKQIAPVPLRVVRADLHRISHGANGLSLWCYITKHALRQVLAPGYFVPVASSLALYDRILVTAGAGEDQPAHVTLVVAERGAEGPCVQVLEA